MKRRKEYYAMKSYVWIYVLSTFIVGFRTIVNYQPYGEAVGMNLKMSKLQISFVMLIQMLTLSLAYYFFLYTKKNRIIFSHNKVKFCIIDQKIHTFVLWILLIQIFFTIKTGNGRVGYEGSSSFSAILNILNIRSFFPIYYFCCRGKKRYWINVFLFCIWQVLCGWTSFVMVLAFYELYMRVRNNENKLLSELCGKFHFIFSCMLVLIGGGLYSYLYRIKSFIRDGYDIGKLTYFEGLSRLISRFTNFPVSLVGIQEHLKIVELYRIQNHWYTEVLITFRPLIPGFLWPGKANLRSLGNIVLQVLYPALEPSTSTGYLCWIYWGNILESNFFMFLFYLFALILFVSISKWIIYAFENEPGLLDFLYFELIFKVFNGSVMESLFGYGYIGLIYILPIMIILGIIKVERLK